VLRRKDKGMQWSVPPTKLASASAQTDGDKVEEEGGREGEKRVEKGERSLRNLRFRRRVELGEVRVRVNFYNRCWLLSCLGHHVRFLPCQHLDLS